MDETTPLGSSKGISVLVVTILVSGLGFLMASAVGIALPRIQMVFGAEMSDVQWIANAYTLVLGALILISGALGDMFGLRNMFLFGIAFFTVAGGAAALAWDVPSLIGFRAAQGIGAACMIPGSLAVLNRIIEKKDRGKAIGLWAGISGAVAALGGFLGGVLTDISFRLVFVSVLPLGTVAFILGLMFIPRLPGEGEKTIDVFSVLLTFIGLATLTYFFIGLERRPILFLIPFGVLGVIALVVFGWWQTKTKHPLVNPNMFNRDVATANAATFFQYFSFSGVFFLLPFHLQNLHGYSATQASLSMIPVTILITLLTGPSGALLDSWNRPKFQMAIGALLTAGGPAWWILRPGGNYMFDILPGALIMGLGMVLIIPAVTKTAMEVKERYSGTASGFNNGVSRVSGLFAVAIAGTVLTLTYQTTLSRALPEQEIDEDTITVVMERSAKVLAAEMPDDVSAETSERITAAQEVSFVTGMRLGYAVLALAAIAAALVSFFGYTR